MVEYHILLYIVIIYSIYHILLYVIYIYYYRTHGGGRCLMGPGTGGWWSAGWRAEAGQWAGGSQAEDTPSCACGGVLLAQKKTILLVMSCRYPMTRNSSSGF